MQAELALGNGSPEGAAAGSELRESPFVRLGIFAVPIAISSVFYMHRQVGCQMAGVAASPDGSTTILDQKIQYSAL